MLKIFLKIMEVSYYAQLCVMYLQLHDTDKNLSKSRKIVNTMIRRYSNTYNVHCS